jgi:hypothetical protein
MMVVCVIGLDRPRELDATIVETNLALGVTVGLFVHFRQRDWL